MRTQVAPVIPASSHPAQMPACVASEHRWRRRLHAAVHLQTPSLTPRRNAVSAAELESVYTYCADLVANGRTTGVCAAISTPGQQPVQIALGYSGPDEGPANQGLPGGMTLQTDSVFLVASVTKPVTVAAALLLVDDGELSLDTRVVDLLSAFDDGGADPTRSLVTVRHLLTHTSGLPDSWPGSHQLRRQRAALSEYTEQELSLELMFPPGTNVSYSSVAIDLVAVIVEQLSGQPLPRFCHERIFQPLGMSDTSLGDYRRRELKYREVSLELAAGTQTERDLPQASRWFGNTDYWRELGCPSGGMLSTAGDLAIFMASLLPDYEGGEGQEGGQRAFAAGPASAPDTRPRLLSPVLRSLMVQPHTHGPGATIPLSQAVRFTSAWEDSPPSCWGLGLRVNADGTEKQLGRHTPEVTYGAHGSSGVVAFAEPRSGVACAFCTPTPSKCYSEEFNKLADLVLTNI